MSKKSVPLQDLNFQVRPQGAVNWGPAQRSVTPGVGWSSTVKAGSMDSSAKTVYAPPPQSGKNTSWGARLARPLMSSNPVVSKTGQKQPAPKAQNENAVPQQAQSDDNSPASSPPSVPAMSTSVTSVPEQEPLPPQAAPSSHGGNSADDETKKTSPAANIKTSEEKFRQAQQHDMEALGREILGQTVGHGVESSNHSKVHSAPEDEIPQNYEEQQQAPAPPVRQVDPRLVQKKPQQQEQPENTGEDEVKKPQRVPSQVDKKVDRKTEIHKLMFGGLDDGVSGEKTETTPYERQPFKKPEMKTVEKEQEIEVVANRRRTGGGGWKPSLPSLGGTITKVRKDVHDEHAERINSGAEVIQIEGRDEYLADPEAWKEKNGLLKKDNNNQKGGKGGNNNKGKKNSSNQNSGTDEKMNSATDDQPKMTGEEDGGSGKKRRSRNRKSAAAADTTPNDA